MIRIPSILLVSLTLVYPLVLAEPDLSKLPAASSKTGVTYAKDIRPILEASCFRCHAGQRPKGDLRLDSLEAVLKGGEHGEIVVAGQSEKSLLAIAVARIDEETAMPPMRKPGGPGGPPGGFPGGPGGPKPPAPPPSGGAEQPPSAPSTAAPGDTLKPPALPGERSGSTPGNPGGRGRGAAGGSDGSTGRPGGPGGRGGPGGPMPKPLTQEQVGLVRAWIDQGAK